MSLTAGWMDSARGPVWTTASIIGAKSRSAGAGALPTTTAWPTANTAILVPFAVAGPVTIRDLFFQAGNSPGTANFDLGIYNEAFALLGSLGATAAVNTTDAILPVGGGALATPLTLPRGRYYLAMSAAATTITVRANTPGNGIARAFGLQQMASAHPLPSTITPASAATGVIPQLGMMTTDTIL